MIILAAINTIFPIDQNNHNLTTPSTGKGESYEDIGVGSAAQHGPA
jgi:hypothetical protein